MGELPAGLVRIELEPVGDCGSLSSTTNVYLATGEHPGLIGTGHPASATALMEALRAHDVQPSDIHRIVATSWDPEVVGGASAFPRADLFAVSPDMQEPRDWNAWADRRRARFLGVADEVFERMDAWGRAELDPWLDLKLPKLTNHLDFIPVRAGQRVAIGQLELEVLTAPEVASHALLFDRTHGIVFGDFELDALPLVDSVREYYLTLELASELGARVLLPTHGRPTVRAARTLKRLIAFCENYSSGLGQVLREPRTLLEVVDGDLGHVPEHPAEYIEALLRHRAFIEDLVEQRAVAVEGEGLDRRYSK